MEERNTNIEQWLREAAARQEQEQAPAADRQAAWDAMRTQLDQPARGGGAPWKRWFGGVLLAGVVLMSVLFVTTSTREEKQTLKQEAPGGTGTADEGNGRQQNVAGNSPEQAKNDSRENPGSTKSNTAAGTPEHGSDSKRAEKGNSTSRISGDAQANTRAGVEEFGTGSKRAERKNSTNGIPGGAQINSVTGGEDRGTDSKLTERQNSTNGIPRGAQKNTTRAVASGEGNTSRKPEGHPQLRMGAMNARNGKAGVNKASGTGKKKNGAGQATKNAARTGDTAHAGSIPYNNTIGGQANTTNTENKIKPGGNRSHRTAGSSKAGLVSFHSGSNSAGPAKDSSEHDTGNILPGAAGTSTGAPASLYNIVTPAGAILRVNATPEAGLLHSRNRVQGEAPASAPRQARRYDPSGFSMQISGNLPVNGTYGGNAAVEYTFDFGNGIRLRPHVGAGYLSGFSETYKHHTFNTRKVDPAFDTFWLDSIITTYTATAAGFGEAGVQLAYSINRWELMAGLTYRYAFSITGKKDSTFTSRPDSIRRPEYAPSFFSTADLPGRGKLLLQAGISYMLTPQLQGGLRYNLQVMGSRKGTGMLNSSPSLPPASSFELQMRWYFRRNSKK